MTTEEETITVYEAIAQMRKLTAQGIAFSLSHGTYNRPEQFSHGIKHCQNAILRPAAKGDDVQFADIKLFYYDQDNRENRVAWQPSIMYFNNKKCILT